MYNKTSPKPPKSAPATARTMQAARVAQPALVRVIGRLIAQFVGVAVDWATLVNLNPRVAGRIAARCGNVRQLAACVKSGMAPSDKTKCFEIAVAWGQCKLVRLMLRHAGLSLSHEHLHRLLLLAATRGHVGVSNALASRAMRHATRERVRTTLLAAVHANARHGRLPMLKYLAAVAGPMVAPKALHPAAQFGHLPVVSHFAPDAIIEPGHVTAALCAAANSGHLPVVRYLACRSHHGSSHAAIAAARAGQVHVLEWLCEQPPRVGVDVSMANNMALRQAALNGHTACLEILLALPAHRGVDPAAVHNSAITSAARRGHFAVVKRLCALPPERGVRPAANNDAALRLAVSNGHASIAEFLCALPQHRGVVPSACNRGVLVTAMGRRHFASAMVVLKLGPGRGVDPSANFQDLVRSAAAWAHMPALEALHNFPGLRVARVDMVRTNFLVLRFVMSSLRCGNPDPAMNCDRRRRLLCLIRYMCLPRVLCVTSQNSVALLEHAVKLGGVGMLEALRTSPVVRDALADHAGSLLALARAYDRPRVACWLRAHS